MFLQGGHTMANEYGVSRASAYPTIRHRRTVPMPQFEYTTKCCSRCGNEYPATKEFFGVHTNGKYGLRGICKLCKRASDKQYDIAHKEERKVYAHQYNVEHHEQNRRRVARWRNDNRQYVNRRDRARRRANPETARARGVNYRAKRLGATGKINGEQLKWLLETQSGLCFYCGDTLNAGYHVDHYVPLSKGGTNEIENIRLACYRCSQRKHNTLPWEWEDKP